MSGRGLEVFEPRHDKCDLLVVDCLDEVGLRAQVSQAVLIPMMNSSCKQRQVTPTCIYTEVLTRDELEGTDCRVSPVVSTRIRAVRGVAPPGIV